MGGGLKDYIRYARTKDTTCIMRYFEPSVEKLHKTGVAEIDADDRIIGMEEKPAEPKSHWCTPPFYYYRREDLPQVRAGIEVGCGTDAPGSFIAWLSKVVVRDLLFVTSFGPGFRPHPQNVYFT